MVPFLSAGLGLPLEDTVTLLQHEAADFKANIDRKLIRRDDEVQMKVRGEKMLNSLAVNILIKQACLFRYFLHGSLNGTRQRGYLSLIECFQQIKLSRHVTNESKSER